MSAHTLWNQIAVSGLVPLSTGDFPGQLSAVIFCQGCPWSCLYCHNPHLQKFSDTGEVDGKFLRQFLRSRRGLLDAIVFSGGEPTMQNGLYAAMEDCKSMGYKIGLHTAGCLPDKLTATLELADWVGLDAKAPYDLYDKITMNRSSAEQWWQSLQILIDSGKSYEVRTTYHSDLINEDALLELAQELSGLHVKNYALQLFRSLGCANAQLEQSSSQPSPSALAAISSMFDSFVMRTN